MRGAKRFMKKQSLSSEITLVIIDEIGKMECFSGKFQRLLINMLETPQLFIATIAIKGGGIISEVKKRSDIHLLELTRMNRNALIKNILKRIHN